MRTNAPPMTALDMRRLSRAEDFGAVFTIHSIFSAKFSAAAEEELAALFSKRSSAAWPARAKIDNVARICDTTCKSRSKKRRSARKRKSKFKNWSLATYATEPALSQARARSLVRRAVAVGR